MEIRDDANPRAWNAIILLAASSALLAQSNDVLRGSQNPTSTPEVRQIVDSSIAATRRHWQARLRYTYVERDESRRRDSDGRVTSKNVDVSRTMLVNGVPFERLLERNGRPPSAEEEREQKEKLDNLKRKRRSSAPSEYASRPRRVRRWSGRYLGPSTSSSWAKR